jgi:hypothetical protein
MYSIKDLEYYLKDFYISARYEEDLEQFNDLMWKLKHGYTNSTKLSKIYKDLDKDTISYISYILNHLYTIKKNKNSLYISNLEEIADILNIEFYKDYY